MVGIGIYFLLLVFMAGTYIIYWRIRHPFWAKQPVFHFYDISYWFRNVGIINNSLPIRTPYTNFFNIITTPFESTKMDEFIDLVRNNYLQNGDNCYLPDQKNIVPYFPLSNSYISFYYLYQVPIGVITGRPMRLNVSGIQMDVYYIDYLCVKEGHRKKNIAAQLIQTHEYQQRRLNPNISVSVFKREEELTAIVPLTTFHSKCFDLCPILSLTYPASSSLTGTLKNAKYFYDWVAIQMKTRKVSLFPPLHSFIALLSSSNLYLEMYLIDNNIEAAYIFKKTCTFLKKKREILTCICSVKSAECTAEQFIGGFQCALDKICKSENKGEMDGDVYGYIAVEEMADNGVIGKYLCEQTDPIITSPNAYFFYNFAHQPYAANTAIIFG